MTWVLVAYLALMMCTSWWRGTDNIFKWYGSREREFPRSTQHKYLAIASVSFFVAILSGVLAGFVYNYNLGG